MDQATSSAIYARKVSAVRLLFVADMRFDFNVVTASPRPQPVGPSISAAMDLVAWADHDNGYATADLPLDLRSAWVERTGARDPGLLWH